MMFTTFPQQLKSFCNSHF